MKNLATEKMMTVREVAEILGVNIRTIQQYVKELFPEKVRNGYTTYLNEMQITAIKKEMMPTWIKKPEKKYKETNIYFILSENGKIKIGRTTDIKKRFKNIRLISPCQLKLLYVIENTSYTLENEIHLKFKHLRSHGEWFYFSDEIKKYISECEDRNAK